MRLLQSTTIGSLTLRNRIVMPPMATLYGGSDGSVSSQLYEYYSRRARGGVGLIVVENTAVTPRSANYPNTLEINHPRYEEGLTWLVDGIKSAGAGAAPRARRLCASWTTGGPVRDNRRPLY